MSFTPTIETSQVRDGTYAAQLGSSTPGSVQNGDCWIYQDVQIPDTGFHLYPFSFSYWLAHVGDASNSYFQMHFLDLTLPPTDPDFLQILVKDNFDGEFWQDQNFDLSGWRGRLVRFVFFAHGIGSGNNIYAYLDDVSLNLSGVEHIQNGGFETGDFTHWKIGYPTIPVPFQALPENLTFFGGTDSVDPGPQTVSVTGNSDSFTVSTDQPWLSASPTSGVTNIGVSVRASAVGLAPGVYTGTVTFTVDSDTIRTVAVRFEVFISGSAWGCGDASVFNQSWDASSENLLASQNDTGGTFGNFAACFDDFTLGADAVITSVNWIGGYFNPPEGGTIARWTIKFYADSAGAPGAVLSTFTVSGNGNELFIGIETDPGGGLDPMFSYKAAVSFAATAGVKYWMSVVPDIPFPPEWGWAQALPGGDNVAYQNFFGSRERLSQDFAFGLCVTLGPPPNPQTYKAGTFTASAVAHKCDGSPDNLEVTGFLDSDLITEHDIRAGLYDNAQVELRVINYADPSMGALRLLRGTTGVISMVNGAFQVELRGLTQKLTTLLGSTYGPVCRAELFGGGAEGIDPSNHWKCRINRSDYFQAGSVQSSADAITIVPPANSLRRRSPHFADAPAPARWFNDGVIKFTSGVLSGYHFEIQNWDGTTLTLFPGEPMPDPPSPGDTFEIEPGCNHLRSDCRDKFVNIINFQGEPDIPGIRLILQTPYAHLS